MRNSEKILDECKATISKRREQYNSIVPFAEKVGKIWSAILGVEVTPENFLLCMVGFKIVRAQSSSASEKIDSIKDMAGYASLCSDLNPFSTEGE